MTQTSSSSAARELDSRRVELAAQVAERVFRDAPDLAERYGPAGKEKCREDTERHLEYLATALAQGNRALFADYVRWAKVVLGRLRIPADDLALNLEAIRDVVGNELPVQTGAVAAEYVAETLTELFDYPDTLPSLLEGDDPLTMLARAYLDDLLRGDRASAARRIDEALDSGVSVRDLYMEVFQRTQYEVGRLWQMNELTVAQEHFITAATQMIMSQMYPRIFGAPRRGRRLVAAAIGGNLHEIGIRMVSDLFELDGWDTHYLGANAPTETVLQTLREQRPHVLALSVTLTTHIPEAAALIDQVRRSGPPNLLILVGGYPFSVDPELWRRVGADGRPASAEEAIAMANQFVDGLTP